MQSYLSVNFLEKKTCRCEMLVVKERQQSLQRHEPWHC